MFSGFTSLLPWSGVKQPTTGLTDADLERGDGNPPLTDDDRLSSVSSFRAANSTISSTTETNRGRDLPDLLQGDFDNDPSTSGCGAGPSSEESVSAAVPGFFATKGRSASTPPEALRINHPLDSVPRQPQDQDNFHTTTSSSSASSNHSYTRFFHNTRTPNHAQSTRPLGPGGINNGFGILSPIYEPSNPDSKDSAETQKGKTGDTTFSKKADAPSIHSTTSTIQERIMNLQANHPAFLQRSLKKSLSQTSSGSLHSQASGAPQLPPLHFRPAFTGISMGVPASPSTPSPGPPSTGCSTPRVVVPTRPQLSTTASPQRSQPNTPQSVATPRSHRFGSLDHLQKCSAIYEDSGSEKSFVTATSGETGPGPKVITRNNISSTTDLFVRHEEQVQAEQQPQHVEEHERSPTFNMATSTPEQSHTERERAQHHSKVFNESEATFNIISDSHHGYNPVLSAVQRHNRVGTASVMSVGSTTIKNESMMADERVIEETATIVEDESFIIERWMKTLFYSASGDRELFSTAKGGDQKQYPVSSSCVLFWVGFIAPWCWLVGGWMAPRDASVAENEARYEKLKKTSVATGREVVPQGEDGVGLKKWILPDPSSNFKATARAPSMSSTATLYPTGIEEARSIMTDPWVRRCRIASIVGGAILVLGLIVMAIVLGVVMG